MSKISQYSSDTSPTLTDYLIGNQASGPTTKKFLLNDLLTLFLNNIPATEGSFGFVSTGMVWSGDAYASTRAASMTAGRVRVNTTFLGISAVTSRIFTASKDTYVDVLDNLDGTGTLVYTEVTNNAASPALAANSVRIAIIVTGASNIAAVGSVNQGEEGKVLPIASSAPYMVTDSLGNLICPRDSIRKILGYRQVSTVSVSQAAGGPSTWSLLTLFNFGVPFIAPGSRKVKITMFIPSTSTDTAAKNWKHGLWDGTVGSGTFLGYSSHSLNTGVATTFDDRLSITEALYTPSAGLHTINPALAGQTAANYINSCTQDSVAGIAFIKIELA